MSGGGDSAGHEREAGDEHGRAAEPHQAGREERQAARRRRRARLQRLLLQLWRAPAGMLMLCIMHTAVRVLACMRVCVCACAFIFSLKCPHTHTNTAYMRGIYLLFVCVLSQAFAFFCRRGKTLISCTPTRKPRATRTRSMWWRLATRSTPSAPSSL